jgi:hypothetical protein
VGDNLPKSFVDQIDTARTTGSAEHRAAPPRVPEPTRALLADRAASMERRREREGIERRSMVRGLLVIAALVLVLSIARAGLDRVFVPGWWRQW